MTTDPAILERAWAIELEIEVIAEERRQIQEALEPLAKAFLWHTDLALCGVKLPDDILEQVENMAALRARETELWAEQTRKRVESLLLRTA